MSPRNESEHDVDEVAVDDEEVEEEQQQHQAARKSKKPKLFNESGLSDEQRRQIRQDQRMIQQSLRENEYSNFDEIEDVRDKNNFVFQTSVRYTREGRYTVMAIEHNETTLQQGLFRLDYDLAHIL
jgi:hypothetical protein